MKKFSLKFDLKLKIFVVFVFIIVCILIGLIALTLSNDEVSIIEYSSFLKFSYPSNFTVSEDSDSISLFSSDKEAIVVLKKIDYTSTSKTKEQSDLAESLSYQVIEDNDSYILTYTGTHTKNNRIRYYYLFENYEEKKQIEVITIFDEDYIYVVIFEANSDEFDLYTESITTIIDSIEV